jgi:hypothetical protein
MSTEPRASVDAPCISGRAGRAAGVIPDPVAAQPGETWHLQAWHRTTLAGQPTSDFTDAVRVTLQ